LGNGECGAGDFACYDATNLQELYNTDQSPGGRDQFGTGNKFITPTVANGKVYVGTTTGVGVFGLLTAMTSEPTFASTPNTYPAPPVIHSDNKTDATLPGPVGWWKFDDGTGTTAADASGDGYTATLVNGISWVTGKIGDAVSANGVNQYVSIPAVNVSTTKQSR